MGSADSSPNHIAHVARTRARIVGDFMRRRNVVACGVGYKVRDNQVTSEPSIMVSVTRKQPLSELPASDVIPRMVDDVATDVVETGEIRSFTLDRRSRLRPLQPGVSIGHIDGSAGTLGCFVTRGSERFALSNNHVLALQNGAQMRDAVVQPGPVDGGTLADRVGELAYFVPLRFVDEAPGPTGDQKRTTQGLAGLLAAILAMLRGRSRSSRPARKSVLVNYVDAALVRLDNPALIDPRIVDIGGPPLGVTAPRLGMRVIKSGRTTGLTQGTLTQIDVTVDVTYDGRTARFANQIMLSPLSQPGDSGSLVLDYERNAVGLLFSGSELVSVANPIAAVLETLQVNLVLEGAN